MKSKVIIKDIKKYKNFNLSIDKNIKDMLLTGKNPENCESYYEIDTHRLVKKTYKLGKKLYKKIKELNEHRVAEMNRMMLADDLDSKRTINQRINDYIETFERVENKNYSYYNSMFDFYKEAYMLLEKNKKINGLNLVYNPDLVGIKLESARNDELFGIQILDQLSDVKRYYTGLFNLLIKEMNNIDTKSLISKMNYIPYNIKYFFSDLFLIKPEKENATAKELFDIILEWCKEFGMPFWTERKHIANYTKNKDITYGIIIETPNDLQKNKKHEWYSKKTIPDFSESAYDVYNNTIPINGLITISISIYIYYSIWENYITNKKISAEKEKDLYHLTAYTGAENIIDLINKADKMHEYIMKSCNSIYELPLEICEKKEIKKKNGKYIACNQKIYESTAIAAWDIFYHDYLGNSKMNLPSTCCDWCQEENEKLHTIETEEELCDACFQKWKLILNRERVKKSREKSKENRKKEKIKNEKNKK